MTSVNTTEKWTPIYNRTDVHQQVTDTIIKQLEAGTIPWQQSWNSSQASLKLPKNGVTQNRYRGVNILLLWGAASEKKFTSQEWASFKQWNSKNETVKKGEKGNLIIYTDTFEKEVDGEIKKIPFLKHSIVFNRCQLASYVPTETQPEENPQTLVEKIDSVENFVANTFADIDHHDGDAYYSPLQDKVYMPLASSFIDTKTCSATENYYSVLLHELTHWTGNSKRLNRQIRNKFGDHAYAEEELVAELGAAFLNAEFEITSPEKPNHASYIANWLKVLKDNKDFIISAASEASKAVDYMRHLQPLKLTV
ncbi:MAG: DUF1738 domain-containing protein [Bacteroidetes bacterium]|nr:DUF1738 domain-containing protein [Bacteroidota bacterium]